MKRLLFILALAFAYFVLEVGVCSGQNYVLPNNNASCPGSCRQITWLAGSDIWNGGTLPSYTGVTCAGLHNNGSTDDGPLIQACINALSSNQCAVIPAGTNYLINSTVRLKSNTCLRGAQAEGGPPFLPTGQAGETRLILGSGAQLTTQNFSFASGNIYPPTSFNTFPASYCTISGTPQKGNTTVVNSSADVNCTLHVNDMIAINGNDDPSLISATGQNGHCDWCGDGIGFYVQQQLVQVTAVTGGGGSGSTITLSKALYYTPDPTSRVVPGPSGSGTRTEPAGVKFQIFTMPTAHAGFENLRIDGSVHDIGSSQILWVQGCFECWVKNVETYMTGSSSGSAHIELDWSYGNEVRDSAFHDQRSGASGAGYGTYFQFTNSDNKVENNILFHNRHSVVFQGGGSGNAWMYNYADDGYTDDLTFFAQATVSHGGHPFFNLFEGNIMSHFGADDFWGSSSHNVLFRNWLRGGEPNRIYAGGSGIPSFPPNNGFAGFSLYTGQPYYSFVNNVLGSGNLGSGVTPTWSGATLSGYDNSAATATPIVYSYGGSASWFSGSAIPSSQTTAIRQGNYDYKTLGVAFNDGGAGFTYQPSYYYASEPSFVSSSGCAWPAQGSDLTTKGSLLQPAYQRAVSGTCGTPTVATPVIGTQSGSAPQRIAITDSTPNSTIRYTADGSTPTVGSTVYVAPIWVAQNQTLKAFATASGLTNSLVASGTFSITPPAFVVGQSTTSSSVTPPTNPGLDRGCCGGWTWADNCTAVGTCTFGGIDNWYAQSVALGAKLVYTFLRVPQYANGSSTDRTLPPTDLAGPTSCPNTDASLNAGGSSSTTDCFLRSYVTLYMRHDCGLSSVPVSPVHGCHTDTFEGWNESNTDSYFSGTNAQMAQMQMDEQQIIKAYSADAKFYLGSTSAGGDGFHGNGDSGIFYTSLLNLAIAAQGMPNFIAPDGFSWHPYNCRTDVIPCPMPTTIISNSSSFCTNVNTPNVHCRVPVYQQDATLQGTSLEQNASIVSWAKNLPRIGTEGGYGETKTMVAGKTATATQFAITANVATVTATNTFTAGESIILQGWNTATYFNGDTVTVLAAGLSGSQYAFNFAHANVGTTADTGLGADAANTTTIRRASLSEWILLLAAQGTRQQLLYAGNDCPWGDYNNCGFGVVPWATGFSRTRTWLASCPITGAFTITAVSGGNVWTRTESCGQYAFFDGWLTSSVQSTAFGSQQNLAGVSSSTGGSVTLTQEPLFLTNGAVPAPPSISVFLMN